MSNSWKRNMLYWWYMTNTYNICGKGTRADPPPLGRRILPNRRMVCTKYSCPVETNIPIWERERQRLMIVEILLLLDIVD